jgi:hypothetical protein
MLKVRVRIVWSFSWEYRRQNLVVGFWDSSISQEKNKSKQNRKPLLALISSSGFAACLQ